MSELARSLHEKGILSDAEYEEILQAEYTIRRIMENAMRKLRNS